MESNSRNSTNGLPANETRKYQVVQKHKNQEDYTNHVLSEFYDCEGKYISCYEYHDLRSLGVSAEVIWFSHARSYKQDMDAMDEKTKKENPVTPIHNVEELMEYMLLVANEKTKKEINDKLSGVKSISEKIKLFPDTWQPILRMRHDRDLRKRGHDEADMKSLVKTIAKTKGKEYEPNKFIEEKNNENPFLE